MRYLFAAAESWGLTKEPPLLMRAGGAAMPAEDIVWGLDVVEDVEG